MYKYTYIYVCVCVYICIYMHVCRHSNKGYAVAPGTQLTCFTSTKAQTLTQKTLFAVQALNLLVLLVQKCKY